MAMFSGMQRHVNHNDRPQLRSIAGKLSSSSLRPMTGSRSLPTLAASRPGTPGTRPTVTAAAASCAGRRCRLPDTFLGEGEFSRVVKHELEWHDRESVREAFGRWFEADCNSLMVSCMSTAGDSQLSFSTTLPASFLDRIDLDATLPPTAHSLRLNRQNLLKECYLHGGVISSQAGAAAKRPDPRPWLGEARVPFSVAESLKGRQIRLGKEEARQRENERRASSKISQSSAPSAIGWYPPSFLPES